MLHGKCSTYTNSETEYVQDNGSSPQAASSEDIDIITWDLRKLSQRDLGGFTKRI